MGVDYRCEMAELPNEVQKQLHAHITMFYDSNSLLFRPRTEMPLTTDLPTEM